MVMGFDWDDTFDQVDGPIRCRGGATHTQYVYEVCLPVPDEQGSLNGMRLELITCQPLTSKRDYLYLGVRASEVESTGLRV